MIYDLKILNCDKIRGSKLKRVTVGTEEDEEEIGTFIGKELQIQNLSSTITNVNQIFMEIVLNTSLQCKNCNTCEDIIIEENTLTLLFKEAIGDLNNITRKTFPELLKQIEQLINAVRYLHERRILHGDIKPANILLFGGNNIKICDYGKSVFILEGSRSTYDNKMYTANYRAPEVWNSNTWGFEADIWALGCTIFYLTYGKHLFPEQGTPTCYMSCLKSWETHTDNLIGNTIQLPSTWTNSEYFSLNSLILRMCNPNELERPSIFDIERDFKNTIGNKSLILSMSPDSICRYDEIINCLHVATCRYDVNCFVSSAVTDLQRLLYGKSYEYASLIYMIYFYLTTTFEFDKDIYVISDIIASSMIGKRQSTFGISGLQISKLMMILKAKKFKLFKFSDYFGRGIS